jgi:hypothetical protein
MKHVYAFTGLKGTGKDTCCDYFMSLYDCDHLSFAEPLKNSVWNTYGHLIKDKKCIWGVDSEKSKPIHSMPIPEGTHQKIPFIDKDVEYWSGRLLLQYCGTELRELIYPKLYTSLMTEKIKESDKKIIVISDLRFPKENDSLRKLEDDGDIIFKLVRIAKIPAPEIKDTHSSETLMEDADSDIIIFNDFTKPLEKLYSQLDEINVPKPSGVPRLRCLDSNNK